jgi:hypothetical protein
MAALLCLDVPSVVEKTAKRGRMAATIPPAAAVAAAAAQAEALEVTVAQAMPYREEPAGQLVRMEVKERMVSDRAAVAAAAAAPMDR